MSLPFLLGYQVCVDETAVQSVLTTYTHPCGFRRAWVDPVNTLLVWLLPSCPVDQVIIELKVHIENAVVTAYNNHIEADMHVRLLNIIADVKADAAAWLHQRQPVEIADFLNVDARLQGYILEKLIAPCAIA